MGTRLGNGILVVAILAGLAFGQTRLPAIGSNPYLSWEMYPQDIDFWHGNFISLYPQYQKAPWWGDIDEPGNKPQATYTTTGTQIRKTEAYFKESAKIHTTNNGAGYAFRFSDKLMTQFDLDYTVNALRDRAEGNFTSEVGDVVHEYIPFDYSLRHTLNSFSLRGTLAFGGGRVPVGMRIGIGFENTLALKSEIVFTKEGTTYESQRALWGWTTSPCAHIFGAQGVEADAWLQGDYARGPLYHTDLQIGITTPRLKSGILFQYRAGRQDQFRWQQDTASSVTDTVVRQNFMGQYQKSEWAKKRRNGLLQAYGNLNLLSGEHYRLNTFASIAYDGFNSRDALGDNLDVERSSHQSRRGAAVELIPNINLVFGKQFHYIDAGLIVRSAYSRFNNRYERWVGGGTVETFWDATVNGHDEDVWERYSWAGQFVQDLGAEFSAMFPVFDNQYGLLGLGLVLSGISRFTLQTNYYGTNSTSGSSNVFTVNNRRENLTREFFFNTALAFNLMRQPWYLRLEVTEPVLHSVMTQTRITDKDGKNPSYLHRKEPLWLSLEGMRVGLLVTYEMDLPFLQRR